MKKGMYPANGIRSSWIFQANPAKYRIEESLAVEKEELWNLNQHASRVHTGDKVYIWISGPMAGIYAIGTVVCEPIVQPDSPVGMEYWWDKRDGARAKPRVWVRYEKTLLDRPLLKIYLENDPGLWGMRILRNPRGTNFNLSVAESEALEWWFGQR
jgi:hypothetical protein